ncbi:MAG TPA: RidA family protein [Methylomirabilota bacterium]|nr:RidA family protein [Methylomirabilota bacterium]
MAEPIVPNSFGPPLGMYSHGMIVRGGELVIVAGQVGLTADGRVPGDDVGSQTKQALENVRTVVEAAGCTMRDVVRLQTFLTRSEDIAGFMKARGEVFPSYFPDKVYPPNTLLVVSRLVRPELLVEIEAMAVRRGGARRKRAVKKRAPSRSRRRR